MENRVRFHLRWWHWLLLLFGFMLVLIVTLVIALRSHGEQQYAHVLAELKAKGKPTTVDDMIAAAPTVDVAVQERWRLWTGIAPEYPPSSFSTAEWHRFVCGVAPVPTDVLAQADSQRPTMEIALQLLREEKPILGIAGFISGIPPAKSRGLLDVIGIQATDLVQVRSLATWLRHQACVSENPTQALSDLDHLLRSGEKPCSLLDAMTVIAVAEIRDEAFRDLALLGRLPSPVRRTWLAEPLRHQEWMARGFEAEHALFNDAWAEQLRGMSWFTAVFSADQLGTGSPEPWTPLSVAGGTWMWCTSVGDCAIMAETETHIAARLRGERADPIPQDGVERMWFVIGKITLPNLLTSASYGVSQTVSHRLNRLTVTLVDQADDGLPRDEADFIAHFGHVLDLGGDHLRLRYERLTHDRFRLVVDPATPVPNFVDASMIADWSREFGRPASTQPLVIKRGSIELQVPATTRPSVSAP